jgi:hypothetical protein
MLFAPFGKWHTNVWTRVASNTYPQKTVASTYYCVAALQIQPGVANIATKAKGEGKTQAGFSFSRVRAYG